MSTHILSHIRSSQPPLVVFDLDSTLFDVSGRTQQIVTEFTEQFLEPGLFVKVALSDWGIQDTLVRELPHLSPNQVKMAEVQWKEKFFDPAYLKYDQPLTGAVAFVQQVANLNCQIVYLTGRSQPRFFEATQQQLESHNFPKGELFLKPQSRLDDVTYKSLWVQHYVTQNNYVEIPFFENEPSILWGIINQKANSILPIWLNTAHSKRMLPDPNWLTLNSFIEET